MPMNKTISAELVITRRAKGEEHKSKYEARIKFGHETLIEDVADFIDGMKRIWTKAMEAAKHCENVSDIDMEICESVYEHETGMEWKQLNFDRWYLRDMGDISTEKGEEGIYLVPDTRYTSENRDMMIGRDILRDMAFTMRY